MKPKTDLEQGDKPCIKSEEDYPDYVAVYDSVKDEHMGEDIKVKMENQLPVDVKSEKLDTEPTVNSMKFDTLTQTEEFDIKFEYVEDTISDLTWDRIEEKLEPGIEADPNADQIKMEFQESGKLKGKPSTSSTNFENMGALGLTEEIDIKSESDESDDLAFDSAQIKKNWKMERKYSRIGEAKQSLFEPNVSATVSENIYECIHCTFKITSRSQFIRHMIKHNTQKPFDCINCDSSFTSQRSLDNHILQKHPMFAASVFSKIHECKHCEYKTTHSHYFASHMMKHTGAKFPCTKCDASFVSRHSLDNHILQKHPEITASVTHKIHECTHCEYKTTRARDLAGHNMKHTGAKFKCARCVASFTTKQWLDNHTLRKHPECTASGSRKIHECTRCEYKSLQKKQLYIHMMKHTATKLTCPKCDVSFTTEQWLDNHILQKHPECTASLSHKMFECTQCEYKTTFAHCLAAHVAKHTGAKLTCAKCDASFAFKQSLGDHILQKHPELIASVSSKVHECIHCQYKTTQKSKYTDHARKHIQP
ncbi:unnamed protein product [Acanthoscelides obtectus]|uniref:C2H2-type domain-containing protein n=1 Tax=Acanthoscelides obtectus TaxID=200917 RepID=A0A9P0PGS9_ACAOB|nr:unnamed protein product [Acanthoscelides obtectus]CAK1676186.1 Zinc finger protein 26 [Acanthoscelides obtectus]